ncbi:hypothetical protein ILYODFUR_033586 [Ilyodon furcidens]|uniref:Uncharacterized protein n=1 Tax=Ilyodon furcidens TaxID=33524 RepID=A0ABV0UL59_9TELE
MEHALKLCLIFQKKNFIRNCFQIISIATDTETGMKGKKKSTKEKEVGQKGKRERRRKEWRKERRMKRIQDNILLASTPAETFILAAFLPKMHSTYECKMYLVVNAAQYRAFI